MGNAGKDMTKAKSAYGLATEHRHPVDMHVGARVRLRRTLLGMTQTGLGDVLGLSFQQMQKYERGTNRISAGRLYDMARVLDVPIEYLFEDLPPTVTTDSPTKGRDPANKSVRYELDPVVTRETLELARAFYKIEDADVRKRVVELFEALGAAEKVDD